FNIMGLLCLGFILLLVISNKTQLIIQRDKQVTLKCNHDDGSYYYMYWYRQRGQGELSLVAISLGKDTEETVAPFTVTKHIMKRPEIKESSLEIKNLTEEDSGIYFCASSIAQYLNLANYPAYFGNGTKLTVLAANVTLPKVKILPPSPKEICSQDKINDKRSTLVCVASGFYPDHVSVSWKVNGVARQDSVSTDTSAQQDKTTLMYHISSRIKVNDTDWMDLKSSFACTVQFFNGDEYVNVTNTINGQKGL
uniref:Ig-like domain-containing protein n=1 Tax=Sinocyclocheilus rhinocerous TaxID=307959 RepID=A0A673NLP3_9TELE